MIDIHTHILPFVDDGSKNTDYSVSLVKEAEKKGVTDIICTPHYRGGYKKTPNEIIASFEKFKQKIGKENVSVNVYLGQEIYAGRNLIKLLEDSSVLSMNATSFILIEFDFNEPAEIIETVYELTLLGYKPIVAHFERYTYATIENAYEIKRLGGYIQINAESIVKLRTRRFVNKMFSHGFVDFVASDIHVDRKNYMGKAFKYIKKKFGKDAAEVVFELNPKRIIKG